MGEAPVAEYKDIFPVIESRIRIGRINYDRAVMAELFLKTRMGVVPIGPVLRHLELILEGFARSYARKAESGHAVHVEWHKQPMPVDRRILLEAVRHVERDIIAFPKAQEWTWQGPVDSCCHSVSTIDAHRKPVNVEVKPRARERGYAEISGACGSCPGGKELCRAQDCSRGQRRVQQMSSIDHRYLH